MEHLNCAICNTDNYTLLYTISDENDTKFKIVKCLSCDFLYLNPRPDSNEINKYYTSKYQPHESKKSYIFNVLQFLSYNWKLNTLKKYTNNTATHLDFGSGDGSFSKFLISKDFTSYSYDPYKIDIKTHKNILEFENLSIDTITLWHSIEHMHDINDVLKLLNSKLKDDGLLFIACPNHNAIDRKLLGNSWVAFDVPRHLYHFEKKTMKKILKNHNLNIIDIKSMHQDTVFNIFKSKKINILNFFICVLLAIFSYLYILFNKNSSSSYLYICKKN